MASPGAKSDKVSETQSNSTTAGIQVVREAPESESGPPNTEGQADAALDSLKTEFKSAIELLDEAATCFAPGSTKLPRVSTLSDATAAVMRTAYFTVRTVPGWK